MLRPINYLSIRGVEDRFERDDDFPTRVAASTSVCRQTGTLAKPIGDRRLDCDKNLSVAIPLTDLFRLARNGRAVRSQRRGCHAPRMLARCCRRTAPAISTSVFRRGRHRLRSSAEAHHRHQLRKLKQMILNHIPQRANYHIRHRVPPIDSATVFACDRHAPNPIRVQEERDIPNRLFAESDQSGNCRSKKRSNRNR
jgi:hypothetical protein